MERPNDPHEGADRGTRSCVRRARSGPDSPAWADLSARIEQRLRRRFGTRAEFPLGYEFHDFYMAVLVKVMEGLDKYEAHPGRSFWSWLLQVAERLLIDLRRRERTDKRGGDRRHVVESESEDLLDALSDPRSPSPTCHARTRELAEMEMQCVNRLSSSARLVYVLRRRDNVPFEAMAQWFGDTPTGTLRAKYKRARDEVRAALQRRLDSLGEHLAGPGPDEHPGGGHGRDRDHD